MKTDKKNSSSLEVPEETQQKTEESGEKTLIIRDIEQETEKLSNPPSIINIHPQEIEQKSYTVRKKRQYRAFLRLIKKKDALSALILSDILQVDRTTIGKWINTPAAQEILASNLTDRIKKIKKSKDWKASAWLVDKATGRSDTTNIQINQLEGLTIIRRDPNKPL